MGSIDVGWMKVFSSPHLLAQGKNLTLMIGSKKRSKIDLSYIISNGYTNPFGPWIQRLKTHFSSKSAHMMGSYSILGPLEL